MNRRTAGKLFKPRYIMAAGLALGGVILPALKSTEAKMIFGLFSRSDNKSKSETIADKQTDVYLWGNGTRTDRSDYLGAYPNFEPTKIETFNGANQPTLKTIILGEGFEGGIDYKGRLLTWPSKIQVSLVEKLPSEYAIRESIQVASLEVIDAAVNRNGLWVLTQKGTIEHLQVRLNRNENGEIYTSTVMLESKKDIPGLANIVQIAVGEEHVLARDKNGLVYCYGDDSLGQCGQGANGRSVSGPYHEVTLNAFTPIKGNLFS